MIPDNVEKIIMTKEDYDRNVEQLLLEKINAEQEIERLNKYKNFIKSIIITLEPWSKNEKGYELHYISKQELYKELYELRQEILKGDEK